MVSNAPDNVHVMGSPAPYNVEVFSSPVPYNVQVMGSSVPDNEIGSSMFKFLVLLCHIMFK